MTDLVWTPIKIRLGQIRPWQDNPRMSTKSQAQRLIKSERELGQIQTLAVSPFDGDYVDLYDGHQRCAAWNTVKEPSFEVTALQSNRKLTEDERRKVSVLLHMATGSWDWNALSSWSAADLGEWGMDNDALKGWNNDANNLKELLSAEVETADAEPQIDRAAELQEKWQTASGQLWQLGKHRLLIGDCTNAEDVERLKQGEPPDFSFTDPPYNVGVQYGESTNDKQSKEKFIEWCARWTKHLPKRTVMTVGIKRLVWWGEILGDPQWIIAWVKKNGQGQTGLGGTNKWDAIICYGLEVDNDIDIIEINNDYSEGIKASGGHPTAKPPKLWEHVIKRFHGVLVYEPFGGSGTTMIACQNLGVRSLLIEIEPQYGAVILERFASAFPDEKIELVSNGTPD